MTTVGVHDMNGHGVDGVNGHPAHGQAVDEPGEQRAQLERDLMAAQERLIQAQTRAEARTASLKDALRRELVASRERVAEMDRVHDERIAEIRRATDAEIARIASSVAATEEDDR